MTDDAPFSAKFAATIVSEMNRIFGDEPDAAEAPGSFLLLPLVSEAEFLDFIRTVPAGTAWPDLLELASRYRAAHPLDADG